MKLDYVPLLPLHQELYALPRGPARFAHYLSLLKDPASDDVRYPPLVALNPMAKEHVAALVEQLLALDADALAAEVAASTAAALADVPRQFNAALVVADDAAGGWTNRFASEFAQRTAIDPRHKRFWVTGVLWSSEPARVRAVREAMATAVFRAAYVLRHGQARTLRELLAQEGYALAAAGCSGPTLEPDDLDYTREVLAPLLDAADQPTLVACLFGDGAARALGYRPHGLSERAGLALALHEAQHAAVQAR
jgi:hypothetical protein